MSFTERFMLFMHSPASRKAVSLTLLLLPIHAVSWFVASDAQHQFNEPATRAVASLAGLWLAGALAVALIGALTYWRRWPGAWVAYAFAAVYGTFTVAFMFQSGVRDATFPLWIIAGSLLLAFWFDERVGGAHLLICMGLITAAIALGLGDVPVSPEAARRIQRGAVLVAVLVLLGDFLLGLLVLSARRLLEQRLDRAYRDLDRTQRLIRRYVPAQLAEQIAAGGNPEAGQHERRRLTLFFSDVAGFTNLSDELDAEELAAFLNEYLSEMTVIADRFGATVNQLVGDGIMIFFGAPTATDDRDHALRCVRMAVAMQRRMSELRDQWFRRGMRRPFQVRIGINTGFASVGDFGSPGRTMYSAIGQQTNLAARIQAHCEPGKVLISHSTWALVNDTIPCRPKGEIEVKGLHYPVLVYEVMDASEETGSGAAA